MGIKLTDAGIATITTLALDDIVYVVRPSLGATGSKKMTVQDFIDEAGKLVDKWIYVLGGMMLETQPGSAIIAGAVPTEDIVIPSSGNRSCGKALVPATNETIFSLKKNGTEFGTMGFAAAGTVPTFTIPSDTAFSGGSDYLTVVNPASPDPTLSLMFFSVWGRLA